MASLYPTETTAITINSLGLTGTLVNEGEIWQVDVLPDAKTQTTTRSLSFVSLVGVTPTPGIIDNLGIKISLSVLLSSILSIWVSNFSLLGIFAILSLANFITSLAWDRTDNFRIKISRLIADFVLVAVVATFAELILGKIQIPLTQLSISVLAVGLYLMILSYLVLISKRLIPLTSLVQSKTLKNFLLSCKVGIDDFREKQEKEILPKN